MRSPSLLWVALSAVPIGLWPATSNAQTFANPAPIVIPDSGPAAPYPSTINVSGVTDVVVDVNVTLNGMNHTFADDIDVLLVGPTGAKLLIMSNAGGSANLVLTTYTFDDEAAATLANSTGSPSGTYKPTNFGAGDTFPAPAPAGPYPDPQLLSIFDGLNPNGTWSLYVFDDAALDVGNISAGWSVDITVAGAVPEPTTLLLVGAGLLGLAARRFRRRSTG